MKLDVYSFHDLKSSNSLIVSALKNALLKNGIIGISNVPDLEIKSQEYIDTAKKFSLLDENIKKFYAPDRDAGKTEGYELGAEWFINSYGSWQTDDKKSSYYAFVPDQAQNKWPSEVDLKTPYLALGELIFSVGKLILSMIGLNDERGLNHDNLSGYGRMLHYYKENASTNENPNWCGAHFDHGIFTGLIPARYFLDGKEIDETEEAGLYIAPSDATQFEKVNVDNKNILLFQAGEFGQLISNDSIKATKHLVKKAMGGIERFSFALFFIAAPDKNVIIQSNSCLAEDDRYKLNQVDGKISYDQWANASYERYRAFSGK